MKVVERGLLDGRTGHPLMHWWIYCLVEDAVADELLGQRNTQYVVAVGSGFKAFPEGRVTAIGRADCCWEGAPATPDVVLTRGHRRGQANAA